MYKQKMNDKVVKNNNNKNSCNNIKYVSIGDVVFAEEYYTLTITLEVLIYPYNYTVVCYKLFIKCLYAVYTE